MDDGWEWGEFIKNFTSKASDVFYNAEVSSSLI